MGVAILSTRRLGILGLVLLVISGCNNATPVPATLLILPTSTAAVTMMSSPTDLASRTPLPTLTPSSAVVLNASVPPVTQTLTTLTLITATPTTGTIIPTSTSALLAMSPTVDQAQQATL